MTAMARRRKSEPEHAVEEVSGLDDLADAVLVLRNRDEAKRFLRDLCTLGELEALAHRWQIARLVDDGRPVPRHRRARAHEHGHGHPRCALAAPRRRRLRSSRSSAPPTPEG